MANQNRKSIRDTALKFGYKNITLFRLLQKNGVDTSLDKDKLRQSRKTHQIDDNYFSKINTRDKAYIIGIISADGFLLKARKQVRISLTDFDVLEDIKSKLNYSKPLNVRKKQKEGHKLSKTLIIANTKIYDDILAIGITPAKSYTNSIPNIPNDLMPDYIRGFFDGNGCIYITLNKKSPNSIIAEIKIVSTIVLCTELMEYLKNKNIRSSVDRDKRTDDRIGNLRLRTREDIISFYRLIYNNIDDGLFMKRKHDKFKPLIDKHG